MQSASGRFVIAFNGEIYNHLLLRVELDRNGQLERPWLGHSDTETLLAAIEAWGLENALSRCVGMFALSVWDRREHCLYLARDRFGEKPLYWGYSGTGTHRALLFGSELGALRAWPGFSNPIHRPALAQLLRLDHCLHPPLFIPIFSSCCLVISSRSRHPLIQYPLFRTPGGVSVPNYLKAFASPLPILPLLWRRSSPRCALRFNSRACRMSPLDLFFRAVSIPH